MHKHTEHKHTRNDTLSLGYSLSVFNKHSTLKEIRVRIHAKGVEHKHTVHKHTEHKHTVHKHTQVTSSYTKKDWYILKKRLVLFLIMIQLGYGGACGGACGSACCSVLCSVLQGVAMCCSVLQCVAVCCSVS